MEQLLIDWDRWKHQLMNPSPAMGQCQTKAMYGKSVRTVWWGRGGESHSFTLPKDEDLLLFTLDDLWTLKEKHRHRFLRDPIAILQPSTNLSTMRLFTGSQLIASLDVLMCLLNGWSDRHCIGLYQGLWLRCIRVGINSKCWFGNMCILNLVSNLRLSAV